MSAIGDVRRFARQKLGFRGNKAKRFALEIVRTSRNMAKAQNFSIDEAVDAIYGRSA
jgi:hypothetical protein